MNKPARVLLGVFLVVVCIALVLPHRGSLMLSNNTALEYTEPSIQEFEWRTITASETFQFQQPMKVTSVDIFWTDYSKGCKAWVSIGGNRIKLDVKSPSRITLPVRDKIGESLTISISGCKAVTIGSLKVTGFVRSLFIGEDSVHTVVVDGLTRSFTVHTPPKLASSVPLVFVNHGGGGDAENAMLMSGMSDLADKEGFIVVYPQGTGRIEGKLLTWNAWNCCSYAVDHNTDDIGFYRSMIDLLEANYPVDRTRIYVTGFSNGGYLSYKLACDLSDKIAAIAPVSGAMGEPCSPTRPVPVLIFHGTADTHVAYEGGIGIDARDNRAPDLPVSYAVDFWTKNNGCAVDPYSEETGSIIHNIYTDCAENSSVEIYTIAGGGHAWPGGKEGLRYGNLDLPTQEINATYLIWDFFEKQRLS